MYNQSPPNPLFTGNTLHSAHSDPTKFDQAEHHEGRPDDTIRSPAAPTSLPPSFVERGEVTSAAQMTTQYTDVEWEGIVRETEQGLEVAETKYESPQIGSDALMKTVDHTLLKLDAESGQFDDLCAEARSNNFATVCVRPEQVQRCVSRLKGSDVKVASVIGFHEGTYNLAHKVQETKLSLQAGAAELDVVINWPELKKKAYASIYNELATLRSQAPPPILLKLILETSKLDRNQIIAGCVLAAAASFDFVKTSTGFDGPGATVENVRLMRACCEKLAQPSLYHPVGMARKMKVKASGGIRTLDDALRMLEAGASRLGTSGGVTIARQAKERCDGKAANEKDKASSNGDAAY